MASQGTLKENAKNSEKNSLKENVKNKKRAKTFVAVASDGDRIIVCDNVCVNLAC